MLGAIGLRLRDLRHARDERDRLEVLQQVVRQLRVQGLADGGRRAGCEERVAIRRRPRAELRRDVAGRPGPVVHDDLLAERIRHSRRDEPHGDVGARAGREADEYAHRLGRKGLCVKRIGKKTTQRARLPSEEGRARP
ncbi:MAG TPA: hypothetical protein VKF40_03530 [Burkholderiales bacterium]|nr:hypothetical protein [Burkholderiales bacterium]